MDVFWSSWLAGGVRGVSERYHWIWLATKPARTAKVTCAFFLGLFAVCAHPTTGHAQDARPAIIAVRAAGLVDVKNGTLITNAVVIVEGDRITAVGSTLPIPVGAHIIDLGPLTLVPGLIDAHTHLLMNYTGGVGGDDVNMLLTVAQLGTARRVLLGAAMAREDLQAGITSVRDVGNSGWNGDVALKDAIEAGWVQGPRIQPSTRALAAAGGQFGRLAAEAQRLIEQEYVVVSGVEETRRAVRQALYDGAEVIKVIVNTDPRVLSLEELKVIVEEAHRAGRPVAAHAIGYQATRIAVEAGVNSVEHAYTISDETLHAMSARGTFLVATDAPRDAYSQFAPPGATPDALRKFYAEVDQFVKGSRDRLRRALAARVKIAYGSDAYYQLPGRTRGEFSLLPLRAYAEAGMTPLQILHAATLNSAELLGWGDRVGSLEVGKFADIVAVEGNPLQDSRALDQVRFVMKGGQVVRNDRVPH